MQEVEERPASGARRSSGLQSFHCSALSVVPSSSVEKCEQVFPHSCFLAVLEEGGVKMKLTVIDTPGFGDQINNENW